MGSCPNFSFFTSRPKGRKTARALLCQPQATSRQCDLKSNSAAWGAGAWRAAGSPEQKEVAGEANLGHKGHDEERVVRIRLAHPQRPHPRDAPGTRAACTASVSTPAPLCAMHPLCPLPRPAPPGPRHLVLALREAVRQAEVMHGGHALHLPLLHQAQETCQRRSRQRRGHQAQGDLSTSRQRQGLASPSPLILVLHRLKEELRCAPARPPWAHALQQQQLGRAVPSNQARQGHTSVPSTGHRHTSGVSTELPPALSRPRPSHGARLTVPLSGCACTFQHMEDLPWPTLRCSQYRPPPPHSRLALPTGGRCTGGAGPGAGVPMQSESAILAAPCEGHRVRGLRQCRVSLLPACPVVADSVR